MQLDRPTSHQSSETCDVAPSDKCKLGGAWSDFKRDNNGGLVTNILKSQLNGTKFGFEKSLRWEIGNAGTGTGFIDTAKSDSLI